MAIARETQPNSRRKLDDSHFAHNIFIEMLKDKLVPENNVQFSGERRHSMLIVSPSIYKSGVNCTRISGMFNKPNLVENGLFPVIPGSQVFGPTSPRRVRLQTFVLGSKKKTGYEPGDCFTIGNVFVTEK